MTRTHNEMSEAELTLIQLRCDAASPAPWTSVVVGRDSEAGLNCIELGSCSTLDASSGTVADQDFIASAREDVPRLIDEIRRLRAQLHDRTFVAPCNQRNQVGIV